MANRLFWSTVALLALTGTLRADIPPPPPSPDKPDQLPPLPARFARPQPNRTRLVFRFDGPDAQPRLRFPAALLKNLPAEGQETAPMRGSWIASSRASLIAAGLALTLSAVAAGLWLTRWRDRRLLGGGIVLVAVVLLNVSGCPWNNDPRWEVSESALGPLKSEANGDLSGSALLEQDDSLDSIQFFISRENLTKFVAPSSSSR